MIKDFYREYKQLRVQDDRDFQEEFKKLRETLSKFKLKACNALSITKMKRQHLLNEGKDYLLEHFNEMIKNREIKAEMYQSLILGLDLIKSLVDKDVEFALDYLNDYADNIGLIEAISLSDEERKGSK